MGRWNYPNCVGAMDGKHILLRSPINSGSYYYNYKHTKSIVLLALCDFDYKFIYIDVGTNGRVADGGVFRKSSLGRAHTDNVMNLPESEPLEPGGPDIQLNIVAGDAAFDRDRAGKNI